jgi:hypothetical protein
MFLANSLKEKLKRDYIEGDNEVGGPLFRYNPPPKDPKILLSIKETMKSNPDLQSRYLWNIPSQQLHSFDKKEWEKTFSISNLHSKWKEKGIIDFDNKFKKFPDNCSFPGVPESKSFVKDLRDPDILELKQKKWNISTNTKENMKPELKKTVFEVKHGLKDFKIVPIKPPYVPEGVDSRDKMEIDGNIWNISNYFDRKEINYKDKEEGLLSKENTIKYWKNNEINRYNEKPLPISNERKKIEVVRYYKKYRTPYQKFIDFQNTMDKVKEVTIFDKENVEKKVKKNNPGMEKYPEKINAIVFKELYGTYRDKYNEIIGNLPKEELKKRQFEKNKFKWNDIDLVNKITAINKMTNTGIFDDIKINYNDKKNITDLKMSNLQSTKNTLHRSQSLNYTNNSILLPLVIKGNDISKEEEKIEEKLEEEFKREQKRQLLLDAKRFVKKKVEDKIESRYPITKEEYYINKKIRESNYNMSRDDNDLQYMLKSTKNNNLSSTELDAENIKVLNEISKSSECNPHFLEAYTKIAGKEFEKINEMNKKIQDTLTFTYSHPGIYRKFSFVENITKTKIDITGQETTEIIPKKIEESFWSCCMNSDPNSKGCQKTASKNYKWNYN